MEAEVTTAERKAGRTRRTYKWCGRCERVFRADLWERKRGKCPDVDCKADELEARPWLAANGPRQRNPNYPEVPVETAYYPLAGGEIGTAVQLSRRVHEYGKTFLITETRYIGRRRRHSCRKWPHGCRNCAQDTCANNERYGEAASERPSSSFAVWIPPNAAFAQAKLRRKASQTESG